MAQTGYTPILIYGSSTAAATPTAGNLTTGASGVELALNYTDGKLYFKNNSGVVTLLASSAGASGDVVGPASATDNAVARFDLTTGKLIQNSVVIIGDTGDVTGVGALSASGNVTLSGGTANGVSFLNASKVLTTGSALTFDGATFATTAVASFAAGSASAPSLTRTGDTNTGIFFPAADTIAFSEGGVESMRIDTSGNLGIGTTSPVYQTQIYGSGQTTAALTDAGNKGGSLLLNTPTVSAGDGGALLLGAGGSGAKPFAAIKGLLTDGGGNTTGAIAFSTRNATGDTALTERMRLDSSGNLGLGVTPSAWGSLNRVLQVSGAALSRNDTADAKLVLSNNAYRDNGNGWRYIAGTFAAAMYQQGFTTGNHEWYTAPSGTAGSTITFTQAMTLDASGNLGIGTTSPIANLEISRGSGSSLRVIDDAVNGRGGYLRATSSIFEVGTTSSVRPLVFTVDSVERARIDSSGNVGIGTSSPTNRLHVAGSSTTQVQVQMSGQADMRIISDTGYGALSLESNMPLIFRTNATERARIDSSGNLLVGTTSASNSGASTRVQIAYAGGSTQFGLGFRPTTNSTSPIQFGNAAGTTVGTISTDASNTAYNTSSDYRLKDNIAPMTGALAKVAALKPVTYKWKADGSDGEGFIAHELAAVVPQCVTGEKDAVDAEGNPVYQGIDTSFLVATLTAAIQEQQALIQSLTARIAALESNT